MILLISACSSGHELRWDSSFALPAGENGAAHRGLAGPVTGIIGDRLIVGGGANFPEEMPWEGGEKHYATEAYIYVIEEDGLELIRTQTLDGMASYPGNCSAEGVLFSAGGENGDGPVHSVLRISLENDSLVTEELPSLPVPLTNGGLAYVSGKLYFLGGENRERVSDKIYELDLAGEAKEWIEAAFRLPYPVSNAVVASDGGNKIYVAGGRMRNTNAVSTIYDGVYEVDLQERVVHRVATLPRASAAGTGLLDREGNLLLFGGDTGETFHRVENLLLQIARTEDAGLRKELEAIKAEVQGGHPGFSGVCRKYDFKKENWVELTPVSGESPVTTTALAYKDRVIIPSGEVRAGVRTAQILVGKF